MDAAQNDLEEIFVYIAGYDIVAAENVIHNLRVATQRLRVHPRSAPETRQFGIGVRKLSAHGYAIFYRVTDTAVTVSRVLHGRRDFYGIDI